jgi:hypothetical protein
VAILIGDHELAAIPHGPSLKYGAAHLWPGPPAHLSSFDWKGRGRPCDFRRIISFQVLVCIDEWTR